MIKAFKVKETEKLWKKEFVAKFQKIAKVSHRKLKILNNATRLEDLKFPRNCLEKMEGEWKGYYSIRINKQYRVCFIWGKDNNAYEVEINKHYE